jgi:hypothetical protein
LSETSIELSEEFSQTNIKVRKDWELGRTAARNIANNLNKMVEILHVEKPDWTINKIANQIWVMNSDLEGFSKRTIYNNLDADNKQLVTPQPKKQLQHYKPSTALEELRKQRGETIVQNNVPEQKFAEVQTNVIEDSSITNIGDVDDQRGNQEEEPDTIYDKSFVERLIKENDELKKPFSFDYDLEVKDQVLPMKVTVYPDRQYGTVRLRKTK